MDPKIDDASSAMRVTKLLCVLHILPQVAHGVLKDVYMIIFKNEHADKTCDVNPTVRNGHHKVKSSSVSEYLQNCFSKLKASFSEAVSSLDMFEDHLIAPSEKTANPLKQMFHCKKEDSGEHLGTHEFNEMLDHLKAVSDYFIPHSEKKSKKSLHFDCRIFEKVQIPESENFEYALKICSSFITPSSTSEEAKRLDLENSEISSFSSLNFEPDEKPLQNYSKEKQKQEKQQYIKNVNLMIAQEPKNIEESLIFNEKKPARKECINRTVYKRKSKKVEMKVPAEDLSSLDEEIHTIELSDYEVEKNVRALKKEVYLLKVKNQELMAELGQVMVEKAAKEREVRKFEFFQQIYRPSLTEAKQSVVSTSNDKAATAYDTLGYPNDNDTTLRESSYANENASSSDCFETSFSKTEATNENVDPTSLVSTAVFSKKAVQGAESLVKETDHRPEKEEHVKGDKAISTDKNENKNPTTQKLPSVTSKKTASGGEAVDQSGNATGASNASSISRGENIEQSSTIQSYDSLSFSVQQDYSNEKEKISLSNVPPTSVATTLYNNYKLLLLSLGQMLLSNDVSKLMTWATQNFPIVNPQNATHVLFQLDENEVINASDLSQLRHFFESIVRFDLVYVIDTFLLGDYGILRQITASKKRDVNTQQTSQTGTTTRYRNLFNAASNSQFSLRDSSLRGENSNEPQSSVLQQKQQAFPTLVLNQPAPNDAKFVPRSPNENHSSAYGLKSVKSGALGFTASQQVVVDGHVTSKLHYCFVRHDIHEKEISYQVGINAKKDYYILQAKVFSKCLCTF